MTDKPTEAGAPGPINLAGMTFATPEQLVGWLAGALGIGPDDYGAIADAVASAIGATVAPATDAGAGVPAGPEGDVPMSGNTTTAPGGVTLSRADFDSLVTRVAAQDAKLGATQVELAQVKIARAKEAAERRADGDIAARGLPASVRDLLVDLAGRPDDALYLAALENTKPVPRGEVGTTADTVDLSVAALSATDRKVASALNLTDEAFMRQKAADKGVPFVAASGAA